MLSYDVKSKLFSIAIAFTQKQTSQEGSSRRCPNTHRMVLIWMFEKNAFWYIFWYTMLRKQLMLWFKPGTCQFDRFIKGYPWKKMWTILGFDPTSCGFRTLLSYNPGPSRIPTTLGWQRKIAIAIVFKNRSHSKSRRKKVWLKTSAQEICIIGQLINIAIIEFSFWIFGAHYVE